MGKQYRIVFKGELLAGHEPAAVRLHAGQRLGASEKQIERLFSGQATTLKRGLSIDAAARYVRELRQMGMRMHVEQDADAPAQAAPSGELCKIVFGGQLVPGYVREEVMAAAGERLHASAQQLALLFSGHKTTLKKGLDPEHARRYASRLQGLGMQVAVEAEQPKADSRSLPEKVASRAEAKASFSHAETHVHGALMHASDMLHAAPNRHVDMDFTQTMVDHELIATNAQGGLPDMEKTELAGEAMLYAYARGEDLPAATDSAEQTQEDMERTEVGQGGLRVHAMGEPVMREVPVRPAMQAGLPSNVVPLVVPGARLPSSAAPVSYMLEAPDPQIALLQVVCAACGARQIQRRKCAHCGYEFPQATRQPEATSMQSAARSLYVPDSEAESASGDVSPPRQNGWLLAALALLGVVACIWGVKHFH